jgi:hypothetical protein
VFTADAGVQPWHGKYALVARRSVGTGKAEVREPIAPPIANGLFAARAYVYVAIGADPPPSTGFLALVARSAGGSLAAFTSVEFQGTLQIQTNTYNTPNGPPSYGAPVPVGAGAWFCLEWDVVLGTPGKEVLFVDGRFAAYENDASVEPNEAGGYSEVGLGITSGDPGAVLRFDDFVAVTLGSTDIPDGGVIGCE